MILKQLVEGFTDYRPRILAPNDLAKAAVLVAITDHPSTPEIILTLRSKQMPTHKGEVAFPGGKMDDRDNGAIDTALREAHEEVGLDPVQVDVIGEMDQVVSRYGFLVTPVLGVIPHQVELVADPREIQSIFRVPLRWFLDGTPDQIDQFGGFRGPRWHFEGYTIWGLTAMMIGEMLNQFYDADIELALGHIEEMLA